VPLPRVSSEPEPERHSIPADGSPIQFALIGVGGIGAYHREAVEALERKGAARLVAVADPTVAKLPKAKAELESRGVRWYLDYRDMLRDESALQAVAIATPIHFHYEMTRACVERGLFVQLEKPPVPTLPQFEELVRLDLRNRVSVGFQMVGSKCMQQLKQLLCDGSLGVLREIRAAACWPRQDNYYTRANWAGRMTVNGEPVFDGPATHALAHLTQNIMYLAAACRNDFTVPNEIEGDLYRARRIESYDTAWMRGRFESGASFNLARTHATEEPLPFRLEVLGTEGWARVSEDGARLETSTDLSCDCSETTQELIDVSYAQFIEVAQGREGRFRTRLIDTRGYMTSVCSLLSASGGIRDIHPAEIRSYEKDGSGGFDVAGLREAIEDTLRTGRSFSEQGCRWAAGQPAPVALARADFLRS